MQSEKQRNRETEKQNINSQSRQCCMWKWKWILNDFDQRNRQTETRTTKTTCEGACAMNFPMTSSTYHHCRHGPTHAPTFLLGGPSSSHRPTWLQTSRSSPILNLENWHCVVCNQKNTSNHQTIAKKEIVKKEIVKNKIVKNCIHSNNNK